MGLFFEKYERPMLHICLRYCRDFEDARDVMQDGFIAFFESVQKTGEIRSVFSFLSRIMINTAIRKVKLNQRRDKYTIGLYEDIELQEKVDEDEEEGFYDVLKMLPAETLIGYIQKLPDGYRLVFNLYVMEDLTHRQIAEKLGITEGASKSQYFKAKKALQRMIIKKHMYVKRCI